MAATQRGMGTSLLVSSAYEHTCGVTKGLIECFGRYGQTNGGKPKDGNKFVGVIGAPYVWCDDSKANTDVGEPQKRRCWNATAMEGIAKARRDNDSR